ncbi:MAG: MauE/DoxX family redox-associated membrane protein [Acidimicrobiales bacterium]
MTFDELAGLGTVAAVGLAAMFLWSATSKLRDLPGTAQAFGRIGLPRPTALAPVVVAAEFAVAFALLAAPVVGAIAAVGLLVAFTGTLIGMIRSGRALSCGCFGADHDEPVGLADVARNVGLLVAALLPATTGGMTMPALADLVAASAAVVTAAVVVQLLRVRQQVGTVFGTQLAGEIGR